MILRELSISEYADNKTHSFVYSIFSCKF